MEPDPGPHRPSRVHPLRVAGQVAAVAALAAALGGGCALFDREAAATWDLAPDQALDADTTGFTVLVTRLGCNSGVTGEVNDPDVDLTDDRVVLSFTVSPGESGAATCQSNDAVPYEVDLPEALGDRELVDGACASATASGTESCPHRGVRYAP